MRRRLPPAPGCAREVARALTWIVGPTPEPIDHMISHARLSAETADATIAAVVAGAQRGGHGVQWNVYGHDEPGDLVDRLERAGFSVQARETVMVLPAAAPSPEAGHHGGTGRRDGPPLDLVVHRVVREDDLDEFVRVQEEVWGPKWTPWVRRWFAASLAGDADPVGVFVVRAGGVPAGAAWVSLPRGRSFASLFGGTVREAFRGLGVYRALVSARAGAAREAGLPWLVADANASSAPRLLRMGFAPLCSRTEMVLAQPGG